MFEADRQSSPSRWPLVRVSGGGACEVVLLSTRFFALSTHWTTSTSPCPGEDCRLCELLPLRGLFYLAVLCQSRVSILELGALSATDLEQHAKLLHGGLRAGLVVRLTRSSAKRPVRSEGIRVQANVSEVSQLELATHVMALYKFPCPNPGDDLAAYEVRCRQVAKVRSDRAAYLLTVKSGKPLA